MHRVRLVLDAQFLARDAPQALGRDLGLRDADHVLVRHAHREMARDLARAACRGVPAAASASTHGAQPVEIEPARRPRPDRRRGGARLRSRCGCAGAGSDWRLRARAERVSARRVRLLGRGHRSGMLRARGRRARRGSRADCCRPPCRRRGSPPRTLRPASAGAREPAMAPSITALMIEPLCLASASMSNSSVPLRIARSTALIEPLAGRSGRRPSRSSRPWHRSGWSRRSAACGRA